MSSFSMLVMWAATGVALGWFASMVIRTSGREGAFFDALVGAVGGVAAGFVIARFFTQQLGEHTLVTSLVAAGLGAGVLLGVWRWVLLPPLAR